MKKSSRARIERRLAKKKFKKENSNMLNNNKCWDELEMLHAGVVGLLYSTKNITPLLRNEEIMKRIDSKEAMKISQIIANDLIHYKDRCDAIHNKHAGKSGGSDNPDVIFETIMIGQEYMDLTESFQMVVTPNIDRILAMASAVADEIDALAKEGKNEDSTVAETTEPVLEESIEVKND